MFISPYKPEDCSGESLFSQTLVEKRLGKEAKSWVQLKKVNLISTATEFDFILGSRKELSLFEAP